MKKYLVFLLFLCMSTVFGTPFIQAGNRIRLIHKGNLHVGAVYSSELKGTVFPVPPTGWIFRYWAQFYESVDNGVPVETGGLCIDLRHQTLWGSYEVTPNFYLFSPEEDPAICPDRLRTGRGGICFLSVSIDRPEPIPWHSYWYIRLLHLYFTGGPDLMIRTAEQTGGPELQPDYWICDSDLHKYGFYCCSGGTLGNGPLRRFAQYAPFPPGSDPGEYVSSYDGGPYPPPGNIIVTGIVNDYLPLMYPECISVSEEEQNYLNRNEDLPDHGFRPDSIQWMKVSMAPDANELFEYSMQSIGKEIDDFIMVPETIHDPEVIKNTAELYFPSLRICSRPIDIQGLRFMADLIIPGKVIDPNNEPNEIWPTLFEVYASTGTHHIIRPVNRYLALIDPNEIGFDPYLLQFEQADILVVPGYENRTIDVRFEINSSLLLALAEFWLSNQPALDLNKDEIVNLRDLQFMADP